MRVPVSCLSWLLIAVSAAAVGLDQPNGDQNPSNVQTADSSGGPSMRYIARYPHEHHEKTSKSQMEDRHRLITDIFRPDYIRPEYILDYRMAGLKGRTLKTLPWGPVVVLPQHSPRTKLAVPPGLLKRDRNTDSEEEHSRESDEHSKDYHHEKLYHGVPVVQQILIPHHVESKYRDYDSRGHVRREPYHYVPDYRENHQNTHDYSEHSHLDHGHYYYAPREINLAKD